MARKWQPAITRGLSGAAVRDSYAPALREAKLLAAHYDDAPPHVAAQVVNQGASFFSRERTAVDKHSRVIHVLATSGRGENSES